MERRTSLLSMPTPPRTTLQERAREAEKRRRLSAESRRKYLELMEKKKAERERLAHEESLAQLAEMKAQVRHRFKIANPASGEMEFESYWQSFVEDWSRSRAQAALEKIKKSLRALNPYDS